MKKEPLRIFSFKFGLKFILWKCFNSASRDRNVFSQKKILAVLTQLNLNCPNMLQELSVDWITESLLSSMDCKLTKSQQCMLRKSKMVVNNYVQ